MPTPLKNADLSRNTQTFSPANILKLRIRYNRSLPPEIETVADILASPDALRSLGLLESDSSTYDPLFLSSLAEHGNTTPALVRPLSPGKEFWEVFAGCRRACGLALLNARADADARDSGETPPRGLSLLALRHDVNDKTAFVMALHENTRERPLNVIELATWAKNSERFGFSKAEAAYELGVTRSTLDHWLALLTLPHRAQQLHISGLLPQDIALHALTSMDEAAIDRLCDQLEEGAAHSEPAESKAITKAAKQSAKTAKRATGGKLSRTPAEMRKELKASGAYGTDMGKVFLSYLSGELDVEDFGWCNLGDVYSPPNPPNGDMGGGRR